MTAPWRNCRASTTLLAEINARWPGRDKTSDGAIGDAAHATRASDHNPFIKDSRGVGVVRARDVDKDGIDAAWCVEHLRALGAARDPRLVPGGYIIFNRRITQPDFRSWRVYTGANPHERHFHVSFSTDPDGFDLATSWGIAPATTADQEPDLTPEDRAYLDKRLAADRAYLDQRFADLWGLWGVRPDPADPRYRRDRLTDIWDRIAVLEDKIDRLRADRPGPN